LLPATGMIAARPATHNAVHDPANRKNTHLTRNKTVKIKSNTYRYEEKIDGEIAADTQEIVKIVGKKMLGGRFEEYGTILYCTYMNAAKT
jgi:hypothetical protein